MLFNKSLQLLTEQLEKKVELLKNKCFCESRKPKFKSKLCKLLVGFCLDIFRRLSNSTLNENTLSEEMLIVYRPQC